MKKENTYKKLPAVELTLNGLTQALLEEINLVRQGYTTLQKARVISSLAKRIVEVQAIQMGMMGEMPNVKVITDGRSSQNTEE